jgi:hypothetical protein
VSAIVSIEEVGLDEIGHLYIRPASTAASEYEYIWRAGMGVRWNNHTRVFHAYEPARWVAIDLYRQVIEAADGEYGVLLRIGDRTNWKRVSAELRAQIESFDRTLSAGIRQHARE